MRALVVIALVVAVAARDNYYRLPTPYSYSCQESRCVREPRNEAREYQSLDTCQLKCSQYGALFPQPTGSVSLSDQTVKFSPLKLRVNKIAAPGEHVPEMLEDATRYFKRNLHFLHPNFPDSEKRPFTEQEKNAEFDYNQPSEQYNSQYYNQRRQDSNYNQQRQRQNYQQNSEQYYQQPYERYQEFSPFYRVRSNPGVERHNVNLEITVTSPEHKLNLETDESYNVVVQTVGDETTVTILASTYYGARHALETVSQLIAFDDESQSLQIVKDAQIQDEPQFKFRNYVLDTGRNFYPKEEIMSLLDAMSYNKMNYFTWHINDATSFPMYSNRLPEMTYYGAYSPRKVYYPEDIKEIVDYAKLRGINVIPELDGPAHTAAGWEWGEKEGRGKLVLCTDRNLPWFEQGKDIPSGQINPVNPEVYPVLGELYRDILEYFDPEMVHMGGDGVSFKCWQKSPEVTEYLASQNREVNSREMFELWNTYQSNAYAKLQEAAREGRKEVTPIIHSSSFARNYVDKNAYIIQLNEVSDQTAIADYVNNGYKVIFSNDDAWRLDCSGTNWYGEQSTKCTKEAPTWEHFYRNSPLDMLANLGVANARSEVPSQSQAQQQQNAAGVPRDYVLGGSVTMWSFETDGNSLQSKSWPRVSAMAERLWSDVPTSSVKLEDVQQRLTNQRERMVYRGIRADPVQPEWCKQNDGQCYSEEQFKARHEATHQ